MPLSNGFSPDPNPDPKYYVRKPGKNEYLDETIYYKRDVPIPKPVEVVNRPIVRETIFLPDRKTAPIATNRDIYAVSPEPEPDLYATTTTTIPANTPKQSTFNIIRALGLNADCPCWAWILIVFGLLLLIIFIAISLYFILAREGRA